MFVKAKQTMNKLKKWFPQARNLIFIFVSVAVLMVSSAIIELNQSKKELLQLMSTQSHSLLESLLIASQNILRSNEYLSQSYKKRLLNNATFVKILYERNELNNTILHRLTQSNKIYSIQVFAKNGRLLFSNWLADQKSPRPPKPPIDLLYPIFTRQADTLILGIRPSKKSDEYQYTVAVAAKDRSAIVLKMDASELIRSNAQAGFGHLLRNIALQNPFIIYTALQDTTTLLAASGNVRELEPLNASAFLQRSFYDSLFLTRITNFDSLHVFEAVHPFSYKGRKMGLFRLGLSLQPVNDINRRIYRRLLFITILLILLGSFMLTYIFTKQRFYLLKKEYAVVETYSRNIIQNVSDAILVFDRQKGIRIFNTAAEKLFSVKADDVLNRPLETLLQKAGCTELFTENFSMNFFECTLQGRLKYLLVSKAYFTDSDDTRSTIIVIRDFTEQRNLEEQLKRKERLTAMGELAAGVAHEIRNPLNTIATIVQQLDKDFEPAEGAEEFHELAQLVYNEVKRINQTIEDFLRFSRPEPIRPEHFKLRPFINTLLLQYSTSAKEKGIDLSAEILWDGTVYWDKNKMAQVLGNLIRNAIEAIPGKGQITLHIQKISEERIELVVADTGPGIPPDVQKKIFNLYFTTKARGTGIGLSIVQRIIDQHNGLIKVHSEPGKGTQFIIQLPIVCCKKSD